MENQIEDLLNEISKFKANITNSNELMDLLKRNIKDIENYKNLLTEKHEQLMGKFQISNESINRSIESIDSAIEENNVVLSKIKQMLQNARINKLFWIILGLIFSSLLNVIFLIIVMTNI